MSDEIVVDICIEPGKKSRLIAGPFDVKTREPAYQLTVKVPTHVRNQVEVNQFLLGTPENCQWAYDVTNDSSWPAFVTITKK